VQQQVVLDGIVLRGSEPVSGLSMDISAEPAPGPSQHADTGDDGHFRFTGLGPGAYTVEGSGAGGIVRPTAVTLDYGPAPLLRLQAEPAGTISGAVVDAWGEPVRNAQVRSVAERDESTIRISTTDGTFRLEGLEPGRYHLSASHLGVDSSEVEVVVSVMAKGEVQATLRLAGSTGAQ